MEKTEWKWHLDKDASRLLLALEALKAHLFEAPPEAANIFKPGQGI